MQRGLALLVGLLGLAALAWRFDWVNDDAYITFTYARSLAQGHGFVHHAAGPAVEGFSELLFTLWIALGLSLGFTPEVFAKASTLLASGFLVYGVLRELDHALPEGGARAPLRLGAAIALGTCAPLAVWSTSGMGVAPFLLAWFATFVLSTRAPRGWPWLALTASCVVALRADGAWWVAWLLGPPLLIAWRRGERARAGALLRGALVSLSTFVAITGWRWATFGDWLPNTARAKLGFGARALERGADYVAHFALTFPGAAALALLALFAAARRRDRQACGALAGVVATVAHAALVGGDFMAFGRFLAPALPFLVFGGGLGLAALAAPAGASAPGDAVCGDTARGDATRGGRTRAYAIAVGGGALVAALWLPPAFGVELTPTAWREACRFRFNPGNFGQPTPFVSELQQWRNMCTRADEWGQTGRDLARLSPPDATVVAGAVGALGWFSERRILDRHGLLSREVARLPKVAEQRSPGHDTFVSAEFFAGERPTYYDVGLWPRALLARHPYAGRIVVLGPSARDGFVLWVLPGPGFEAIHPAD
ncbi:MAG: hypothetical protein R3F49_00185 [Planctomycetota bacterium]